MGFRLPPGRRFRGIGVVALLAAAILVTGVAHAGHASGIRFKQAIKYTVGSEPDDFATGDFNGDGHLDAAVTNFASLEGGQYSMTILKGGKGGTLTPLRTIPLPGFQPDGIAAVTLGTDKDLDLVVGSTSDGVDVFTGGPGLLFSAPVNHPIDESARLAATGDFNGDGFQDVAASRQNASDVAVMLGAADGSLGSPSYYPLGGWIGLAAAPLNGDGLTDLVAISDDGRVSALLGKPGGGFLPAKFSTIGANPSAIAPGDFNGDGKVDLAVLATQGLFARKQGRGPAARRGSPSGPVVAGISLGNGNGTFSPPKMTQVSPEDGAGDIAVADFDRDGRLDAVASLLGSGQIAAMRGLRSGKLAGPVFADVGEAPYSVTAALFNGDRYPDVAAATFTDPGKLSVVLQKHKKHHKKHHHHHHHHHGHHHHHHH